MPGWDPGVLSAKCTVGLLGSGFSAFPAMSEKPNHSEISPRLGCTHPLRSAMRICPPFRTSKILTDLSDEQVARRVP